MPKLLSFKEVDEKDIAKVWIVPCEKQVMKKRVLITGITGQDGSYMAEYCLNLGHEVHGMVRRTSTINLANVKHLLSNPNFKVVYGDLLDGTSLDLLVKKINPHYFINFAAQSFVGCSWEIPEETFMAGAVGVLKCLEAVRKNAPHCRFYNAGSSEQFGDVAYVPQDEKHPFRPRSPYGAAKCAAHYLVKVYRESYNLYAVQGLLFNHESERRGEEFVTRKITKGVGRIVDAIQKGKKFEPIELGNLDSKRDWSHSKDFIDGIWRMLNQEVYGSIKTAESSASKSGILLPRPVEYYLAPMVKEYVLASGETHTIREFVERAFNESGIDKFLKERHGEGYFHWYGDSIKYGGADKDPRGTFYWSKMTDMGEAFTHKLVEVNSKFFRPAEVEILLGDSALIQKELGWKPTISFDNLVKRMVECDLPKDENSTETK
jgi:GDPmannose 4,6-dehydratase